MLRKLKKLLTLNNRDLHTTVFGITVRIGKRKVYDQRYNDLPIQNNKIIFRTFNGSYSCNPKYIAEEIIKQNLPYELVWEVTNDVLYYINDFPLDKVRLVLAYSDDDYKEAATAKIIVENERRIGYVSKGFHKKKGQVYIGTWHGSLGIKKTGAERSDVSKNQIVLNDLDSLQFDFLLSNSSYTTDFLKKVFDNNGQILEYGLPRNDVFFGDSTNIKNKVLKKYNIPTGKKILMYAPTFRENYDLSPYSIDFLRLRKALTKRFGGDWVVLYRLHPRLIRLKGKLGCDGVYVIDVSAHSDMQELLVSSDVVITDYSSCIFDFILSRRPGLIFATDSKKFSASRGLYYPLASTPFPVATNNDELVDNVEQFDNSKYLEDVDAFLRGKGCIDDGHASKRVVASIKQIISDAEVSR